MGACLFCSGKRCENGRSPIFAPDEISCRQEYKLAQFIRCIFKGDFSSGIPNSMVGRIYADYEAGCCIEGGPLHVCCGFVAFCLDVVYRVSINQDELLQGSLTKIGVTCVNWISNITELYSQPPGSLLFTLPIGVCHIDITNQVVKDVMKKKRRILLSDIIGFIPCKITSKNYIFTHVCFYLGATLPNIEMYVAGMNHPTTCGEGSYLATEMFTFDGNGIMSYLHPTNQNTYYLLACSVNGG